MTNRHTPRREKQPSTAQQKTNKAVPCSQLTTPTTSEGGESTTQAISAQTEATDQLKALTAPTCEQCHRELQQDWQHCPGCGTKIEQEEDVAKFFLEDLSRNGQGRRYPLRTGINTLGSAKDCGIQLADDWVSSLHAWFQVLPDEVTVEDTDSTNGVFLAVRKHTLRNGDVLLIGKTLLRVIDNDEAQDSSDDASTKS